MEFTYIFCGGYNRRNTGLARPSVCLSVRLSVCPIQVPNSKTIDTEQNWREHFPEQEQPMCQILVYKVKGQGEVAQCSGRIEYLSRIGPTRSLVTIAK